MRFLALFSWSVGLVAAASSLDPSSSSLSSSLEARSVIERRGCTRVSQCHSKLGAHEQHVCKNHACHRVCKKGYSYKKSKCVKTSSSSGTKKPTSGNSSPSSGSSSAVASFLQKQGVSQFHGVNGPGIASWYHTNSGQDSTNGHSWCGFPYSDSVPGIAIDVSLMLNNFGGDWRKAGTAYCGLEVKVKTPEGRSALLYVADGFDPAWIRQKGSIDVIYNSWSKLSGFTTSNKNDVVQGVTWEFTGRRNEKYAFGG